MTFRLKSISAVSACLILSLTALGCSKEGGKSPAPSANPAGSSAADVYPENGLPKDEKVNLKIGFHEAGMGREWFDFAMDSFKKKFPNVSFEVVYSPKIADIIGTKISANNDNDMFDLFSPVLPGGNAAQIPLVESGKVESQEDLWDYKVYDGKGKTVKELAIAGEFEGTARILGKTYLLPTAGTTTGLFFNKKLFEKNGWNQNPKTWDEFLKLGETIKAAGIIPITSPGMYPDYLQYAFGPWKLFELADMKGKLKTFEDDFRNFRNEYTSPESVERWNRVYELGKKGFFPEGMAALNHTQSQMQVLQGKAAMVSTGAWVQNEMKDSTPTDFKWGFMAVPMGDKPDSVKYIRGSFSNGMFIWSAKPELNKKWAKQFIVWMWNLDVQTVIADKGGQLSVRSDFADDPARADKIQDSSKAVAEYIKNNKVVMESAFRDVTLTDPAYAQSVKVISEAASQIATGKQDPLPKLQEAQQLIDKAIAAQKK
ncbi:ABC transporter substrate-binding protein [Paenibacillus sp. GCM10012303]|uniref:ABC transporter substrate-binding protein n=1 Tax=Paenibacillus sp. GCM10012303 TaxID=3317340 RepID=UPI0036069943